DKRKIFLIIAILIISGLSLITSINLYKNIASLLIEEKGEKAMSVSIAVAKLIEQDYPAFQKFLEADNYSEGSYDKAYYDKMQRIFQELKEMTEVKFLYCGKRISDHEIVYLFDGEDPDSELFSPLGSKDYLNDIEQIIYSKKDSGFTPIIKDPNWGELLSGVTPIIDPSTGKAVAHVGVDVSVSQIQATLANIRNVIFFNSIIITIITSLIVYRLLCMNVAFTENDYLTGLRSKGYQERFLNQLIKKSNISGKPFPLIMIDFDDFKNINDKYGHQFGDVVLKSVSTIIKSCSRSIDCCSRWGGDEFVIILPETNLEYASLVCEWLLKEVSNLQLRSKNDILVTISISIGIALWEKDLTAEQILIRADKALYQSKRTGKNKMIIYTDDLE
ncbi:MAG: GGDEF domain-containing protein, partial [Bacillota bacterium]